MLAYVGMYAICYTAGVYLYDYISGYGAYLCVILWAAFLTASGAMALKMHKIYFIIGAVLFGIGMLGCYIANDPRYNELYILDDKFITVDGYVTDIPDKFGKTYSYKVRLISAEYKDKEYSTDEIIRVTSEEKFKFGDVIHVRGFLKEFSDRNNSTDFNTKRYYQSRGVFYKMYTYDVGKSEKAPKYYPVNYYVNRFRSGIADNIDKVFSGDDSAVLKAVGLGNKRQFSDSLKKTLLYIGMTKFMYSSYLHIFLINAFILLVFSCFKKGRRELILVAALLLYAVWNASFVVNVKNAVAVGVSVMMIRKLGFTHYNDIVGIAVLSVCVLNPLYCFDVGMVISVSFGLVYHYIGEMADGFLYVIPFRGLRKAIKFYLVSTFGLLPIIAYYFEGINIYTNMLAPLYSLIVGELLILLVLMNLFLRIFGVPLFTKAVISPLIWYFTGLPRIIEKLPFSKIWIKSPSVLEIAAFYLLVYIIYQIYIKNIKKTYNIAAAAVCVGLWGAIFSNAVNAYGSADIRFVNVGQGDGAVISVSGGETVIVDGGGRSEFETYDAGENIFLPYLTKKGYTRIDKAVVTHYHSDHVLGVIAAAKTLKIGELVMPDCEPENEYRKELEKLAAEKNIKIHYAKAGDTVDCGSGLMLRVLLPGEDELKSSNENEQSVVMRVDFKGFKCLFTGDIGKAEELKIMETAGDCDVVKMAHHGSAKSSCAEFTEAVSAEYAIASVGENNTYGFPTKEAVENYRKAGTKVLRTDINGDITVHIDKNGKYNIYKSLADKD